MGTRRMSFEVWILIEYMPFWYFIAFSEDDSNGELADIDELRRTSINKVVLLERTAAAATKKNMKTKSNRDDRDDDK